MLLGVTSHLTMDIASLPLLWVLPLAVYLVTMIVSFGSKDPDKLVASLPRLVVVAVIASMVLVLANISQQYAPILPLIGVQVFVLLLVGLLGHATLAADRPSASRLTEFFIIVSVASCDSSSAPPIWMS